MYKINFMNIGISTAVLVSNCENWDRMNKFIELGFTNIELYNKITRIRLADAAPLAEIKNNKAINFSFHSLVQDLFCGDEMISQGESSFLKAEIRLASLIGCRNLVFHISKKTELSEIERGQLADLADFAAQNKINLCLENNFSTGVFSGDYLAEVVNKVENLYCCLDIGHLNVAVSKGLIINSTEFIERIKHKILQLHISFNDGESDEHLNPTTDYQRNYFERIINSFKKDDLSLIIETRNIDQAVLTNQFLKEYV